MRAYLDRPELGQSWIGMSPSARNAQSRGPGSGARVLLVDDDHELMDLVGFSLRRAGMDVVVVDTPERALRLVEREQPDVILLDVHLGVWNGLDLLAELRRRGCATPVILVTARSSEEDTVRALELGADDYITKPFGHRELIARIKVQLRRGGTIQQRELQVERFQVGPLRLDVARYEVTKHRRPIAVSATEFQLLHVLMQNAGRIVRTGELLEQVWRNAHGSTQMLRIALLRLRRKIEDDPSTPRLIRTVPGVGVTLRADIDDS